MAPRHFPLCWRHIVWSALLLRCAAMGQDAEVTNYSVADGLPQSMVNHVLQDADGFLWLGTGDGLARFDGSRFVVYKHDPHDSTSLSHNSIWGLSTADRHHLYVGTRSGLDKLDLRSGTFERLPTGDPSGPDGCWQPLFSGEDRDVFYSPLNASTLVLTHGAAVRRRTGHSPSYCMRTSTEGDTLHLMLFPDSMVSVALHTGTEQVELVPNAARERILAMIRTPMGLLLLGERRAWCVKEDGRSAPLPQDLLALVASAFGNKRIERAPDGRYWLALSGVGVAVLRPDLSVEHVYRLRPAAEQPLRITSVHFDHQGNTWVGTDGSGVFRIAPQRIKFGRVMPDRTVGWQPASWFVRGFEQWDADRVLVSFHQGGLALYNERTGALSPAEVGGIGSNSTAEQLHRDADGVLWMTIGAELLAIEPGASRIVHRGMVPTGQRLMLDRQGRVITMGYGGSVRHRMQGGTKTSEPITAPLLKAWLDSVHNPPSYAAMDPTGRVWTSGVLTGVDVWSVDVEPFRARPFHGDVRMNHLLDNGDGSGWISTNDGLYKVLWNDLSITAHLLPVNGLPDRFIYGMVKGGTGEDWFSSNRGLSRGSKAMNSIRNYTTADGLQSMEFNSRAHFRSRSGRVYFGGINGFNHFLPGEVVDDRDTPGLAVVRVRVQDSLMVNGGARGSTIRLPYPNNRLELEIAVLEMSAPEQAMFRYRLAGYQEEWRSASPQRGLVLERIPHGSYTLELQAITADGIAGPVERALRIEVPLPFWASTWFSVLAGSLMAAAIAGSGFMVYRRRKRLEMERVRQELNDLRSRTRLAKDIHDDVGSGLARMAALARSPKRTEDPERRFEKVGEISGELLDNLRDVVWMNDPRHGTIATLLVRLREHGADLFEDSGIQVSFDLPEPLPTNAIGGGARRNLYLIGKEAMQNALKYSRAGTVVVHWRNDADSFIFQVSDNGNGITGDAPEGGGAGSLNMQHRAQEMGATYVRTSLPSEGTTVRVHGPTSCLHD